MYLIYFENIEICCVSNCVYNINKYKCSERIVIYKMFFIMNMGDKVLINVSLNFFFSLCYKFVVMVFILV